MIEILKICVLKVFNFVKKFKFLKIREFFLKIRKIFFFFVLKCKQKEHVHNLNRRWAQPRKKGAKRLEFLVLLNTESTDDSNFLHL